MPETQLVKFDDDIEIEVPAKPGEAKPISSANASKVHKNFEDLHGQIAKICAPFKKTFSVLSQTEHGTQVSKAEVELSLAFTVEGNVYLVKAKGEAGVKVKLTFERGADGDGKAE